MADPRPRGAAHARGHGHGHGHGPSPGRHGGGHGRGYVPVSFDRAFAIGIALNLGYVAAEAVYGVLAQSLALLADAGHNFGDVLGLALAWGAAALGRRRPTHRHTYGLRSTSIFAALANAILLLVVTGGIVWEAIRRLNEPEPSAGLTIVIVATAGIAVNAGTALLFRSGRHADLNIRAAFMHMAADALIAAGVVATGALILWTGWLWLDPASGLLISAVIIAGTWGLLRDSVNLALGAVPHGIDRHEVEDFLGDLPGVTGVHDLHIWGISTTETALTVHLVRPDTGPDDALLTLASEQLRERFAITHATFQVESGDVTHTCSLVSADS